MKDIRDIRIFSEKLEKDFYKPKITSDIWNNDHIEYESNSARNKSLWIFRQNLRDNWSSKVW